MTVSRRRFLTGAGAAAGLLAADGLRSLARAAVAPGAARALPAPDASGIEHIVVLCMENRSFDHQLGWVRRADGVQSGLTFTDDLGLQHSTYQLDEWSGCGFNDPDHSFEGGATQLNGGRMDGFVRGANDDFALGYYGEDQLATSSQLVRNFTIVDRYFSSILGPTYPNRFYTHAATTDRIDNSTTTSTLPTIWDRLQTAGISSRYYFSDLPFLALWGSKYASLGTRIEQFFADAAAGRLAAYSYLDPYFLGEDQGGSNDDHPHADIRRGQALIAKVVNAVMQSPNWASTVLVITYDEWGGFFEHVVPPVLPDTPGAAALPPGTAYTGQLNTVQAGFRVPCYLVSPFARAGAVASGSPFNHASLLKMVEWRWGLAGLNQRDRAARNLAEALDFTQRNPSAPIANPISDPGPHLCVSYTAVSPGQAPTPAAGQPVPGGAPMGTYDPFWVDLKNSPNVKAWGL